MRDYQTTPQLYLFSDLRSTVQQSITRRIAGSVAEQSLTLMERITHFVQRPVLSGETKLPIRRLLLAIAFHNLPTARVYGLIGRISRSVRWPRR